MPPTRRSAPPSLKVLYGAQSRRTALVVAAAPALMGAAAQGDHDALLAAALFASVALILVAVLAYQLGLKSALRAGLRPKSGGDAQATPDARSAALSVPPSAASAEASLPPPTAPKPAGHPVDVRPESNTRTADAGRPEPSVEAADAQSAAYAISHDLRAPLRVVEGFARILKEDHGRQLDRIGNDHLDRVLTASARMNAMIEAMLTMARISSQPLSRQQVNLSQIARFVLEDLRGSAPDRPVQSDVEDGLVVTADPTLMRQLMENLLSNAWKYTSQVDAAHIRVRSLTDAAGRRVFEVADNGAGFDMRSSERLFGLFQRLHAAHDFPGTGVGLASVQRIVRRHGGDVWAESAPGRGARFQFTLG